jgi:hypothetical protein
MSISFCPYIFDSARGFYLLPPAVLQNPDAFELNVGNDNGDDLLLAIGLDPAAEQWPMLIDAFSALVTAALRLHLDRRSPTSDPFVDQYPGQMTFIHCGRREGYIEEKLDELAVLVQRSRSAGATHFGWG